MRQTGSTSHTTRADQIAEFLEFLSKAQHFVKRSRATPFHPAAQRIRNAIEEPYPDQDDKRAVYQKFESTFYQDAPNIIALLGFLEDYESDKLRRSYKLTVMELNGLMNEYHPIQKPSWIARSWAQGLYC